MKKIIKSSLNIICLLSSNLQYTVRIFSMLWRLLYIFLSLDQLSAFYPLHFSILKYLWVPFIWILWLASLPLKNFHFYSSKLLFWFTLINSPSLSSSGCISRLSPTAAVSTFSRTVIFSVIPFNLAHFQLDHFPFLCCTFIFGTISFFDYPLGIKCQRSVLGDPVRQTNCMLCCMWTEEQISSDRSPTDFERNDMIGLWSWSALLFIQC